MEPIHFEAEVKKVVARKTASLDKEIEVVLITNQEQALKLQEWIAKDTITVEVKK